MVNGRPIDLGKMAHLQIDDVHVIVSSVRMQALDQSQFRVVGIEPSKMNILALKSANHYRADFGPLASTIINVESPSAIIEDPSKIPYTQLREGVRLKGLGPVYHRP
jgi:microcystin degradation protein MlrC